MFFLPPPGLIFIYFFSLFFFSPSVVARHVCANQSGPLVLISPTYISLQINDAVQEGRSIGDKVKVSPLPAHGAQGWDEGGSRGGGHTKLRECFFLFVFYPKQFQSQMPFRNHREGSDLKRGSY